MENQEQENPQIEDAKSSNDKVSKAYDANMEKLISLFSGKEAFKKVKVKNNDISSIVDELLTEKREQVKKDFKAKASALLESKVKFDKTIEEKRKEFDKLVMDKKKEFSKEMEDCFALVESIDILHKDYVKSLQLTPDTNTN